MIDEVQQPESFWKRLQALALYLKPFQVATDVVQSDHASLVQVYKVFHRLLRHVADPDPEVYPTDPFCSSLPILATNIIQHHWRAHVNIPATIAAAILSFSSTDIFEEPDIKSASSFIVEFGAEYLHHYKASTVTGDIDALKAQILKQYSDFRIRSSSFRDCNKTVEMLKSVESDPAGWNASGYWALQIDDIGSKHLALTALVLLQISASEAAVERTFSSQDQIHTKKRNRLLDDIVEKELFTKFNYRAMNKKFANIKGATSDMLDVDSKVSCAHKLGGIKDSDTPGSDSKEESDVAGVFQNILESDQEADSNEPIPNDDTVFVRQHGRLTGRRVRDSRYDAEAAGINADTLTTFIEQYIQANNITSSYNWSKENKNLLEAATLQYKGFPSLKHIIARIQSIVPDSMNDEAE
jgi:hypothetical protein